MNMTERAVRFSKRYKIDDGRRFRLKHIDPGDTAGVKKSDKGIAEKLLREGIDLLCGLQEKLYAQDRWALLLIFQAMDAAGKDGAIKHVMSGINPQGCQVYNFKAPSSEDLDHDFLWRTARCLPERGRIGIFNRSYYEETLVVRIHPELLERQKMPLKLMSKKKKVWEHRFEDIVAHERYLAHNGVAVRKFFLHVSKAEQRRRFLSRLEEPAKNWKFSGSDLAEREHFDDYMRAYEDMIRATSTPFAPWYVVPADNKWFTRVVIASAVIAALEEMDLAFPKVDAAKRQELAVVRQALEAEGQAKKKA